MRQHSYTAQDVAIVIPTLNAENFLGECIASIPPACREVIVIDGGSIDGTIKLAENAGAAVLHGDGTVAAARTKGIAHASKPWVLLLDTDVILRDNAVANLLREIQERGLTGLQARLHSVSSGPGYWGRALANHHNSGKASSEWFSFSAALCEREALINQAFDDTLSSGEDLDLVYRLRKVGAQLAISDSVVALHRYGDSFQSACYQWLSDGEGLVAVARKHGMHLGWLLILPLAGGVRGILAGVRPVNVRWIPYYVCFIVFNYIGMIAAVLPGRRRRARLPPR